MHFVRKNIILQAVIIWSINYCYCLLQTQAGETLKGMYVIQTWQTTLKKDMNRADRQKEKERERYSPKRHEGLPGGMLFLTSILCFIKAANWAVANGRQRWREWRRKEEGIEKRGITHNITAWWDLGFSQHKDDVTVHPRWLRSVLWSASQGLSA